jgi:hypothetical protein
MSSSALMRGVPVISHLDLDATLSQIVDHVINKANEVDFDAEANEGDHQLIEAAADAIRNSSEGGSNKRETVP